VRISHGGLSVDVPAGFTDRSTLLFVGPPRAALPTAHAVKRPAAAVSVTFSRLSRNEEARAVELAGGAPVGDLDRARARVEAEARALQGAVDVKPLHAGPFESGLGVGWRAEVTLVVEGTTLREILYAVARGPLVVCAAASLPEWAGPDDEAQLDDILRSLSAGATLQP
jgi:hypothetical protein